RDGVEGMIVQPASPAVIENAVRILVEAPEVRRRLAAAARTRARDFDFERTVRAYESYYGKLVTVRRAGAFSAMFDVSPPAQVA
ncbi:unnamed protein product, partial [marine sediment metagenome]